MKLPVRVLLGVLCPLVVGCYWRGEWDEERAATAANSISTRICETRFDTGISSQVATDAIPDMRIIREGEGFVEFEFGHFLCLVKYQRFQLEERYEVNVGSPWLVRRQIHRVEGEACTTNSVSVPFVGLKALLQ